MTPDVASKKHVGVLEQAGLVVTKKVGQRADVQAWPASDWRKRRPWIEHFECQLWAARFDALDKVVADHRNVKEKASGQKKRYCHTKVEQTSDRELVVTRTFRRPRAHRVRRLGPRQNCSSQWWAPKSIGVHACAICEMDVRTGGGYICIGFAPGAAEQRHEVFRQPYLRSGAERAACVWTNEDQARHRTP